jgi:transglutaminase-like putative cysteine protease
MRVAAPPEPQPPAVPAPADWRAVARIRVAVHQQYRYEYAAPIADLRQRLVMLPPDRHGDQRLVGGDLAVDGADGLVVARETDAFGNRLHRAAASRVREAVEFTASYTVERRADGPPARLPQGAELAPYLAPTALTAPSEHIRAAAAEVAAAVARGDADATPDAEAAPLDGDAARQWALARGAADWTAGAITYRHGVTGVQTPAAMALHLGSGVCQDFAHLALAVLRALGVPARYVSGHLLGEGAPHAWCEALLPDPDAPGRLRAVPYDPTHRARAGLNYVTVAVGRDYADVAPTSGSFTGAATGTLTAIKDAWIVDLDEVAP